MRFGRRLSSSDKYFCAEVALNELLLALAGEDESSTTTLTQVADNAASVTLLSANQDRIGCVIVNTSSAILYVAFAATATTSAFTYKMNPQSTLELYGEKNHKGVISGIWNSDPNTGSAVITEIELT